MEFDSDVLSPHTIFNLMIELLAKTIHSHPSIMGFRFWKGSHKINLFADDIILLLTSPEISLPHAFQTLTQYILLQGKHLKSHDPRPRSERKHILKK